MDTPWAVLLCKFSDDDTDPYPRARYEEVFTSAGAGKWNMPDYFRDMSHGAVDLSGSQVFGWYTLDQASADYKGSGVNQQGREDLITWARQKATDDGVDLSAFFSVVVFLNRPADLFGGGSGAVGGDDGAASDDISSLGPSVIGQEMGHVYGLAHSRQEGSVADYTDPYDIMSTKAARMAPHPVYTAERTVRGDARFRIGPGLNAANMAGRGWLDPSRVWTDPGGPRSGATVQLRPLHRRDLPGFLAIRFGDYFIEFRMDDRWDAAMPAAVLLHRFEGNQSYLVSNDAGMPLFTDGSALSTPEELRVLGSNFFIRVQSIDTAEQSATVAFGRSPAQIPLEVGEGGPMDTPWIAWGGLELGEGVTILHDGRAVRVPAGSAFHDVVRNIADVLDPGAAAQGRQVDHRQALSAAAEVSLAELTRMEAPGGVAQTIGAGPAAPEA